MELARYSLLERLSLIIDFVCTLINIYLAKETKSRKEWTRFATTHLLFSMEEKQQRHKIRNTALEKRKELTCIICSSSSLSSILMKFWSSGMEKTSH